jgi:diaminohydroxyphosphoribosylaminopyrimidine deaminase/5-amino-6-(5-phosphoribosylamino)uracil reductase
MTAPGVESSLSSTSDERFMRLALTLGRRGQGNTAPNPAVGAVVVRDGVIVGRGWTAPGGRPHAEPQSLQRAGEAAKGATLYVTLEPCSHFGKTPPCVDAIIAAGIARVVSAIEDPNPEVAGQGHARLREAGIVVETGLCADEAAHDHAGHISRILRNRPHVSLKLAVSSDGKIAAAGHRPVAITGETVRSRVHLMRAMSDAVLIGIGTALADDPELTCRLPGMLARSPARVVLDRSLRLPPSGKLAHGARQTPLWVYASETAEAPAAAILGATGTQVIRVADAPGGLDLAAVLHDLNTRGVTRLMVEGGARVAASFVRADFVDEVWLYRNPMVIGDDGIPALEGLSLDALTQSSRFALRGTETIGSDSLSIYGRI